MQSFESYCKTNYGLVSKWWKYTLLAFLVVDAIVITTLAGCYEGLGDLGEMYFEFNDRVFYVGFME